MGRRCDTSSMTRVRVDKKMREENVDADVLIAGGACCWSSERVEVLGLILMVV